MWDPWRSPGPRMQYQHPEPYQLLANTLLVFHPIQLGISPLYLYRYLRYDARLKVLHADPFPV